MNEAKCQAAINKFQSLLRSGKDYTVDYMYSEVGKVVYLNKRGVRNLINRYYQGLVSQQMIDFVGTFEQNNTRHLKKKYVEAFSNRFNVCERESRLLIRYVKLSK